MSTVNVKINQSGNPVEKAHYAVKKQISNYCENIQQRKSFVRLSKPKINLKQACI